MTDRQPRIDTRPLMSAIDLRESLTADNELEDTAERTTYSLVPINAGLLTNPAVVRAIVGIVLGLVVLAWPNRSDEVLARLVGVALIWAALSSAQTAFTTRTRVWSTIAMSTLVLGAGVFLVFSPNQSAAFLGRLIGGVILLIAIRAIANGIGSRRDRSWVVPSLALAGAGALIIAFPEEMLAAATAIVAVAWILISLIVVAVSLDGRRSGPTSYHGAATLVSEWMAERPKSVDARQALYAKVLFEGPNTRHRIIRFFALMGFAAVIASMGVLTDSTAVVIGAMLIAPLMTPLMGMAMSLVMGWPNRLARSTIIAFSGIVFAIAIGFLLGLVAPALINTSTNTQILARSSPTVLDLMTAVAAGAAGAYGLSRPDVSDSLPGVAIAISLVPPLSVVGIAYSQGDWSAGNGALLLFTTNIVAILVMGGLTFILTGVTPVTRVADNQHRVQTSIAAVLLAAVVVMGGLFLNGTRAATNLFDQSQSEAAVERWLEDAPAHTLVEAIIDGDTVTAVIVGPSDGLGDIDRLADELGLALGRTVTAGVRLIVEERFTSASN